MPCMIWGYSNAYTLLRSITVTPVKNWVCLFFLFFFFFSFVLKNVFSAIRLRHFTFITSNIDNPHSAKWKFWLSIVVARMEKLNNLFRNDSFKFKLVSHWIEWLKCSKYEKQTLWMNEHLVSKLICICSIFH